MRCDLLILGDTPDAWAAAEAAASRRLRTLVLRPDEGSGVPTGIAAVLSRFGDDAAPAAAPASPSDLWQYAVRRHDRRADRFAWDEGVPNWRGRVRLTGPTAAEIGVNGTVVRAEADRVLIAVGTTARRPTGVPFDGRTILLPEDVPNVAVAPPRLAVLGGGRTARAFARLFAAAGSAVTLIDAPRSAPRRTPVGGYDVVHDEASGLLTRWSGVSVRLASGGELTVDAVLFAAGRPGATASLGLHAAGLEADEDGRLWCDADGRTWNDAVAAAGEVVGYPRPLRDDTAAPARAVAALFDAAGVPAPHFSLARRFDAASGGERMLVGR